MRQFFLPLHGAGGVDLLLGVFPEFEEKCTFLHVMCNILQSWG